MRPRLSTRIAALHWLVRIEYNIRRRRIDVLADMTGLRLDFAPSSAQSTDSSQRLPISSEDIAVLRFVAKLYSYWPSNGTCLRESLVAGRLLRYRDPTLRIGVKPSAGRPTMHAWLEVDGVAVDPTAGQFAVFGAT